MSSVNKAIVLGNLGQDPEVRYTQNGAQVTTISVATSEKWKDKNSGQMQEKTEWHRIVFFGRLAEVAGQYLQKGSKVYVEGPIETNKWQDSDGNTRYSTQIKGLQLQMLSGGEGGGAPAQGGGNRAPARQQGGGGRRAPTPSQPELDDMGDFDDDIPF